MANLKHQGFIKWDNGSLYQGGLINGVPEGQGKYEFGGYELNGMFKNGLLNGKGEYIDKRELSVFSYKGDFLNGLYHGEGHYLDLSSKNDYKGTFISGSFYGVAKYYFQRDSSKPNVALYKNQFIENDFIVYEGEMKADLPDGNGVCTTQEFKYNCEFYKGYLIGIGDYSLLPDYITKE
jgi:hypothetical protein